MKSKQEKRKEALTRLHSSIYDSSKAKRRGQTEEEWLKTKAVMLNSLTEKVSKGI